MDNNINNNNAFGTQGTQSVQDLHEEKKSHAFWYWIIGLLILILFGWYAYSAGWFTKFTKGGQNEIAQNSQQENQKEQQKQEQESPFGDENLAPIDSIRIDTSDTFPVRKTLVVKGNLPDSCTYLNSPQVIRDGNTFYVNLTTRKEGDKCNQVLKPYELPIELEVLGLPAGVYTLVINGKSTQFELEQDNKIVVPDNEQK